MMSTCSEGCIYCWRERVILCGRAGGGGGGGGLVSI